jgi:hypothetical protein
MEWFNSRFYTNESHWPWLFQAAVSTGKDTSLISWFEAEQHFAEEGDWKK